ncbi:MAG: hypothetical protein KA444_01215 [Bacteroidia bacterium]|nr:hypothetical protein [Bacteroidia bacterium]
MKTCISNHLPQDLWQDCLSVLRKLNYFILQENAIGKRISARSKSQDSPHTVLMDICLIESSGLIIVSVDAVQNNTSDGMLSTHAASEILFMQNLLKSFENVPNENSFRLRSEDYLSA